MCGRPIDASFAVSVGSDGRGRAIYAIQCTCYLFTVYLLLFYSAFVIVLLPNIVRQLCMVYSVLHTEVFRGGSRILGKGGSDKYIHNWGGYRVGGVPPLVTARGSGGALIAPPVGSGAAAFLLLCLFSMKFTVISNTYTSRDIRITRTCMDSDEKTVHSSQCYSSYCSVIKFVTQSFCEFVIEARL